MRRKEGALAAVIRFENLGGIIWSPRFKRYYFLEQKISDELYEKIVNRGMKISEALNDMSQLKEKFYDIGVDDDARIIVNKNKTNRPLYAPLEYYFDYTNKCNLRCKDCYNKKHFSIISTPNLITFHEPIKLVPIFIFQSCNVIFFQS